MLEIRIDKRKLEFIEEMVEKLDFLDIIILKKFYFNGKFPGDSKPWCFPLLFKEMKEIHKIKIGREAFRKRLDKLVKLGFLEKIKKCNPSHYLPVREKEKIIKIVIKKFLIKSGIPPSF